MKHGIPSVFREAACRSEFLLALPLEAEGIAPAERLDARKTALETGEPLTAALALDMMR